MSKNPGCSIKGNLYLRHQNPLSTATVEQGLTSHHCWHHSWMKKKINRGKKEVLFQVWMPFPRTLG